MENKDDLFNRIFEIFAIIFTIVIFLFTFIESIWLIHFISEKYGLNYTNRDVYDYLGLVGLIALAICFCLLISPIILAHLRNLMKKVLLKYDTILLQVPKPEGKKDESK